MRDKYFSIRPKPLERWIWSQRVPPAAERVFWLHWQEGLQRRDWCSEIPLRRVARECCVDLSTVTKAYQLLMRIGCLRRTDPGRDPANPFQQAIAVTEVRIPHGLLSELGSHPNRRTVCAQETQKCVQEAPVSTTHVAPDSTPRLADPFAGLSGKQRVRALGSLTQALSATEQAHYRQAQSGRTQMSFDTDSKLSHEDQGRVLQLLAILTAKPERSAPATTGAPASVRPMRRQLPIFELARLKRDVQDAVGDTSAAEILRQVLWSLEEGTLQRFPLPHAINIALKKIRQGQWTRPHRIPPNWVRSFCSTASLETCRRA